MNRQCMYYTDLEAIGRVILELCYVAYTRHAKAGLEDTER